MLLLQPKPDRASFSGEVDLISISNHDNVSGGSGGSGSGDSGSATGGVGRRD